MTKLFSRTLTARRAMIGLGGLGGLGTLALLGGLMTASPALACHAVPTDAYGNFSMDCSDEAGASSVTHYAAIARETNGQAIGYAWNYASRGAAEAAARSSCDRSANAMGACSSVIWASNACAAIAFADDGSSGTGWSENSTEAGNTALSYCNKDSCKIRKVVCND